MPQTALKPHVLPDRRVGCKRLLGSQLNETKVNALSSNNWEDFFNNTKKIMRLAIKNNGTTLSDMTYFLPYGEFGSNQNFLKIYSKTNCFNCGHIIDKIYINQRATYFCRKCQKLKN